MSILDANILDQGIQTPQVPTITTPPKPTFDPTLKISQGTPIKSEPTAEETSADFLRNVFPDIISKTMQSAKEVAQFFIQTPARFGASATVPLGTTYQPKSPLDTFLFGNEPIKPIQQQYAEAKQSLQSAGYKGLSSPIAGTAIFGGGFLNLLPAGEEENLAKSLLKTTDASEAANLLSKVGVSQDLIPSYAKKFAEATTPGEVQAGIDSLKNIEQNTKSMIAGVYNDVNNGKINPESFRPVVNDEQVKTATTKLIDAINEAKPVRNQAEKLYSLERTARAGAGSAAMQTGGEAGFGSALGKLKGELPKPNFTGIRTSLEQPDIDNLFTKIQQNPNLDFYSKITAQNGLNKLLGVEGGAIPTNSELKLLQDTFGKDLTDAVLNKKTLGQKIFNNVTDALNVPRALVSSMDMSAPLRQGLVLSTAHPITALQAGADMVKVFFSQKGYDALMQNIASRPTFKLMQDSGLAITDITGKAVSLADKEESFMSNFAEKIPIIGQGVKASERAYTGFLNKLRADVFDDLTSQFIKRGITPAENPDTYKFLADFVNTASGRGSLGETLNRAAPVMNSVFFSPRLMASRFNMLNPAWYLAQPPAVRAESAKAFVSLVGTGIGILSLAKLSGADVGLDPRSTDFGKIKVGPVRWDVWGGFQQWVRLAAQLITGQSVSSNTGNVTNLGKDYGSETRLDKLVNFFVAKFAPIPSLGADLLRGTDAVGQPIQLEDKVIPFYIKDLIDATKALGPSAIPTVGIPGFFGVGTQTYQPSAPKKSKANVLD